MPPSSSHERAARTTGAEGAERIATQRGIAISLSVGARALSLGLLWGGALAFLATMSLGLLEGEVLHLEVDGLDLALRMLIGATAVAVASGAALEALRRAIERIVRLRAAERTRDLVPLASERAAIEEGPVVPAIALLGALGIVFVLAAICGLALLGDDDGLWGTVLAVSLVGLALAIAGIAAVGSRARRWRERIHALRSRWGSQRSRIRRSARDGASRGTPAAPTAPGSSWWLQRRWHALPTIVLVGGMAVGMAGVLMRQPCRGCDPQSYDSLGEGLVDVLVAVGTVAAWAGAIAVCLQLLAVGVFLAVDERKVQRALRLGGRVPLQPVTRTMLVTPMLEMLGTTLVALGVVAFAFGVMPDWGAAVDGPAHAAPLAAFAVWLPWSAALLAAGLVVGIVGAADAVRRRDRVLEAMPGFDPSRPSPSGGD